MPWKECHVMDERLRFVARLLEGEKMAPLCAEFGISRKTGYKIFERYKDCGVTAFTDRSRRPHRQANRLPAPLEATIVRLKREYPGWGAPKIREKLRPQCFERTFKEFGLPGVIRTDNGVPFASAHAIYGLSKLSVWWLRLGIQIERIKPGHPQQNGRHERMHLTLKKDATKPAAANVLQQQARFDTFIEQYNQERPHQGLGMKVPADVYRPSPRRYRGLEELTYPFHDQTIAVTRCGRICFKGRKVNLSHVFAGQNVGVTQVGERIWLVTFMQYDLGYFDDETCRLEPIENPFGPKVLPLRSE